MSLSNKIIIGLIFFIMFVLGLGAWDIRQNNIKTVSSGEVHAGVFDDIVDAITGHSEDLYDRITKEDEFISGTILKEGTFDYTKDSIHWAKGSYSIIETDDGNKYIQLGKDFESGLAPDLYFLTSVDVVKTQSDLDNARKVNLTKLKKGKGASYYLINKHIDVKSIVIWCRNFNQLMGSAVL